MNTVLIALYRVCSLASGEGNESKTLALQGVQGRVDQGFYDEIADGVDMSVYRYIIAEPEFLDDTMDNFNVLWREFQDLEAGIVHIQAEIRFAPPAAGREFHERFFGNLR
jgi:hypothetical protein